MDDHVTEKELLLEAIARRSQFTFDMLHWITHVTGVLLALSNSAACDAHSRDKLQRHARWLISVLSFVPHDEQTVRFLENFKMTETLFRAAMDAVSRGCAQVASDISRLLLSWTFDAGHHQTGYSILERGILGLAVLTLVAGDDGSLQGLKTTIAERLANGAPSSQELRDRAALEIRGRAATLYQQGDWGSAIEQEIAQADHAKLRPFLEEIARSVVARNRRAGGHSRLLSTGAACAPVQPAATLLGAAVPSCCSPKKALAKSIRDQRLLQGGPDRLGLAASLAGYGDQGDDGASDLSLAWSGSIAILVDGVHVGGQ